jgi:hypothetical protein
MLANADDLQIPQCVDTADEAIAVVRDLQAKWKAGSFQRISSRRPADRSE